MITGIEIDLSSVRVNQAGEMSSLVMIMVSSATRTERAFSVRAGSFTTAPVSDATVAIMDHREIEIGEDFVQAACSALGISLEGRELHEMDSSPKVRKFMPAGRKTTYMG